ncbi:MAG: hypothetical protein QXM68_00705 [Candidatus Aenigmatarchaeota archaeon]|nr:hypothetical protein [Candidatus Aenigmarchaeota archaeon]
MNFLKFMLLMLGVIGLLLIAISLWMIFINQNPEAVTNAIAYLSISIGILYLIFIVLMTIILKKLA